LSLSYAALFLAAGAALLAITYGLLASNLPTNSASSLKAEAAILACKGAAHEPKATGPSGKTPQPVPSPASCRAVFAAGARANANSQRQQTLHNLLLFSLIALGAMTLVSGGVGWLMAGRVLGPVRAITVAARRASERHLGERLHLRGPRDELKELADTFDDMLDRLDAAFASQRRFVSDASHELRTPLTVMRTAIDVTLAKPTRTPEQLEAMAMKIRRSVDEAEALIGALLWLASSDQPLGRRVPVDLASLAEAALDGLEPQRAGRELRVSADLAPAPTTGDALLLGRLVGNLVDNAVRHNVPGGWIDVRTGTTATGAVIEVRNSGQFIADADVPTLFEPFRRIEQRTNVAEGVGLGLAIVKSIAHAHGATIEARGLPAGGLDVVVVVPPTETSSDVVPAPVDAPESARVGG
jgi:signal transduction histidine kinase